jgi:hypothetical protein
MAYNKNLRRLRLGGLPNPSYADIIAESRHRNMPVPVDSSGVPLPGYTGVGGGYTQGDIELMYTQVPPGSQLVYLDPVQFATLLDAIKPWQASLRIKPFTVGVTPIEVLPQDDQRTYLLIVNTSAANRMFIGFDNSPVSSTGLPLEINLGGYEPDVVPTNAIYAFGAGAGTTGICIYAN